VTLEERVGSIERALERGDVEGAADELLAAWRDEPHPELADALDRFPARRPEQTVEDGRRRSCAHTSHRTGWKGTWGASGLCPDVLIH
jgi:uncharacterized membrane-anchored protein